MAVLSHPLSAQRQAKQRHTKRIFQRLKAKHGFTGGYTIMKDYVHTSRQRGQEMFQIAPLDSYRVILQVDERDIAHVKMGQPGQLTLSGMVHDRLAFAVDQITPISTAQEGRNFFRVEARLENTSERVRPGMEGVGKIVVGERKLLWIWTHSLIDWLRLSLWKWLP